MEKTLESQRIFRGHIFDLRVDTVELPNGRRARREIVEHGDAVTLVPVDQQRNILLVRQFRKAVEGTLLELPAGGVHPGETPEDAAQRELQEETGYRAGKLVKLGAFYTTPGFCTEFMHLFLATQLTPGELTPEEDELIEVVRVPLGKARELAFSGEIRDGKSLAGLFLALPKLS